MQFWKENIVFKEYNFCVDYSSVPWKWLNKYMFPLSGYIAEIPGFWKMIWFFPAIFNSHNIRLTEHYLSVSWNLVELYAGGNFPYLKLSGINPNFMHYYWYHQRHKIFFNRVFKRGNQIDHNVLNLSSSGKMYIYFIINFHFLKLNKNIEYT